MRDYAEQQTRLLKDIETFQTRNVQAAYDREEAERERLEKMAEAAAAQREQATRVKETTEQEADGQKQEITGENVSAQQSTHDVSEEGSSEVSTLCPEDSLPSPDASASGLDSFTYIEKEEILGDTPVPNVTETTQVVHSEVEDSQVNPADSEISDQSPVPLASDIDHHKDQSGSDHSELTESADCATFSKEFSTSSLSVQSEDKEVCEKPPSSDSSESPRQSLRPRNLFSDSPLPAQESLDSPCPKNRKPVDDSDEDDDDLPSSLYVPSNMMTSPPAEMLLSPQYVSDKNLTRKLFSVNRVSESSLDASQAPPSSDSSPRDLLNTSTPPKDFPTSFSTPPSVKTSLEASQISSPMTPGTLVKNLTSESVKQLESDLQEGTVLTPDLQEDTVLTPTSGKENVAISGDCVGVQPTDLKNVDTQDADRLSESEPSELICDRLTDSAGQVPTGQIDSSSGQLDQMENPCEQPDTNSESASTVPPDVLGSSQNSEGNSGNSNTCETADSRTAIHSQDLILDSDVKSFSETDNSSAVQTDSDNCPAVLSVSNGAVAADDCADFAATYSGLNEMDSGNSLMASFTEGSEEQRGNTVTDDSTSR